MSRVFFIVAVALGFWRMAWADEANHVSMIQLIATPDKFHQKQILVGGYLRIEFEGNILYFSESAMRARQNKEGIWLGYEKEIKSDEDLKNYRRYFEQLKKYSGQYVQLEGTYDMSDTGHFGCCSGAIVRVSRVIPRKGTPLKLEK